MNNTATPALTALANKCNDEAQFVRITQAIRDCLASLTRIELAAGATTGEAIATAIEKLEGMEGETTGTLARELILMLVGA